MTVITGNRQLAARAREPADRAPRGTLERRAAGVLAVALGTTRSVAAARKVLDDVDQADIRTRARELLAELLERDVTSRPAARRAKPRPAPDARSLPGGELDRLMRSRAYVRPLPVAPALHQMARHRSDLPSIDPPSRRSTP